MCILAHPSILKSQSNRRCKQLAFCSAGSYLEVDTTLGGVLDIEPREHRNYLNNIVFLKPMGITVGNFCVLGFGPASTV